MIQITPRLLRRNVRRGAHDEPVHGFEAAEIVREPGRRHLCCRVGLGSAFLPQGSEVFRQPPIHDQHFTKGADHDVLRLQVAVHDALRVRERHGVADLLEDRQQGAERILLDRLLPAIANPAQHIVQGRALDELHRVENLALVIDAQFVNGDDIRVLQLARELGLVDETQHVLAGKLVAGFHHLHGHGAANPQVARLEDHAHPAPVDRGDHLVFLFLELVPHLGQAEVLVPQRLGELLGRRFAQPDEQARRADLHLLIQPHPRGQLHLDALDEDAVAAAKILDDEFVSIEGQPRMVAGNEIGIDRERAGGIAPDDVLAVLDRVLGFELLADVNEYFRLDFIRRHVRIGRLRFRHYRGQFAHSGSKSTSTIRTGRNPKAAQSAPCRMEPVQPCRVAFRNANERVG